jgi:hypothetical protein
MSSGLMSQALAACRIDRYHPRATPTPSTHPIAPRPGPADGPARWIWPRAPLDRCDSGHARVVAGSHAHVGPGPPGVGGKIKIAPRYRSNPERIARYFSIFGIEGALNIRRCLNATRDIQLFRSF